MALAEHLANGGTLVVAEGYVFEFERRGYLRAGAFVPEVVLKHPDMVKALHEEFVHAGSDVVLAFTYYGHREKLRLIGKEDQLEEMNRQALRIARDVARAKGKLFAGNICNSTIYKRNDNDSVNKTKKMFQEQIEWAVDEGVDFIVGETFGELGEAMLALDCIKEFGNGTPAVITLVPAGRDVTYDGHEFADACRQLEDAGAAVVGLNCGRGPASILPLMRKVRDACKGPVACLPVTYRTSKEYPTMQSLVDPDSGNLSFPYDLPAQLSSRTEIANFADECKKMGVDYIGLCCGNCSHYMRVVAEHYGRITPASKYSPDMSQHFMFGDKTKFSKYHQDMVEFTKIETA